MRNKFYTLTLLLGLGFSEAWATQSSRFSDEKIPMQVESIPDRPKPLLEIGPGLLENSKIGQGFTLPTGATWQPSLVVWGTLRSSFQAIDDDEDSFSEWSNRLDLFGNLYLTSTERILVGIRPLDKNGSFSGYAFDAPEGQEKGSESEFNFDPTVLFFEGDFGEIFPFLDPLDKRGLDVGIALGRQPIQFQNGMLINDNLDALGLSKINLRPAGAVNTRVALLWAWDELNRENLSSEDDSSLFGVFTEVDLRMSTLALDVAYVGGDDETGDGIYGGLSAIQRLGGLNSTFRVLASSGSGEESIHNSDGVLLYSELSKTLHGSDDFVYWNAFWGIDEFSSASRGASAGGPLNPAGILYSSMALGRYGSALDNDANNTVGSAVGIQMFLGGPRRQLTLELAGRYATEEVGQKAIAGGFRFQQALGQRNIIRLDGFACYGKGEMNETETQQSETLGIGGRIELMHKF